MEEAVLSGPHGCFAYHSQHFTLSVALCTVHGRHHGFCHLTKMPETLVSLVAGLLVIQEEAALL